MKIFGNSNTTQAFHCLGQYTTPYVLPGASSKQAPVNGIEELVLPDIVFAACSSGRAQAIIITITATSNIIVAIVIDIPIATIVIIVVIIIIGRDGRWPEGS